MLERQCSFQEILIELHLKMKKPSELKIAIEGIKLAIWSIIISVCFSLISIALDLINYETLNSLVSVVVIIIYIYLIYRLYSIVKQIDNKYQKLR